VRGGESDGDWAAIVEVDCNVWKMKRCLRDFLK